VRFRGWEMPRKLRVEIEGGLYHVYNRIGHEERPFVATEESERFIRMLLETKRRDGFQVLAWCLMPNHFHLAVRTRSVPLSRSMHSLQQRYAMSFNRRRGSRGALWQGRYNAKLVQDQRYFDQLLAYIHLNPVTAGLVGDPVTYPWSGHRELLSEAGCAVVDVDEVLIGFGRSTNVARAAYVRTVKGARTEAWVQEGIEKLDWWRREDDREIQPSDRGPYVDMQGRSTGLERPKLSAAVYLDIVTGLLGVEVEEVADRSRRPGTVRRRELIAVIGAERYGVPVKRLAELLGRSRNTVSSWVSRGAARRASSASFCNEVDALDRLIASS